MPRKPRKQIEDMIEELRSWLPNYDSKSPNDYPILLFRILASMPGGDELEDMGYETFNLGWHEMDQLARVLDAIQDKYDVEDLVHGLTYEEEEDVGEARRRPSKGEWWIHWHGGEPEGPFEKREYAEDWATSPRNAGRSHTIRRGDPEARRTREAPRRQEPHPPHPRAPQAQEAHAPAHRPAWPTAAAPRKKAPRRRKKTTTRKKTPTRRRR